MLKHVFAISGFHPLFSNKSVAEIIEAYENKTKEFESRFKMYRDVHFVGRQNEMSTIKKLLTVGNKGNVFYLFFFFFCFFFFFFFCCCFFFKQYVFVLIRCLFF